MSERLSKAQIERIAGAARQYRSTRTLLEQAFLQTLDDLAAAEAKLARIRCALGVLSIEARDAKLHPHGPQGRLAIAIDLMHAALGDP